ncbi:hypothetical protein MBLNU459_g2883t1 [Dothideomycetes sp. NU459]
MKLDTKAIRYLTSEDWRVLTAVEMGSRNHEVVPTPLIANISGLRGGSGVHKSISALAKVNLIAKVKNAKYDGYRLTYGGLDYLALNTHRKTDTVFSLGNQIGVGKESDIYVVASPAGTRLVLKIHRLGRISFRTVKANRDYLRNRSSGSWMYLSRLAAMKEYAFMKVLRREGFPVPEPVGQSRHTIVMEFIDSFPLRQIESVPDPASLYSELLDLIVRLARVGLIHGDFNEFNILIKEEKIDQDTNAVPQSRDQTEDEAQDAEAPRAPQYTHSGPANVKLTPILIDFPQMLSTTHANAEYYFDRDVACIKRFFARRFHFESDEPGPFLADAIKGSDKNTRLDIEVEATGFSRKMAKELDKYIEAVGGDAENEHDGQDDDQDADASELGESGEQEEREEQDPNEEAHPDTSDNQQFDDPKLVEDLGSLDLQDDSYDTGFDSSFLPLEVPRDNPVVAAEKKHSKKKAAGWAI